MTVPIETVKKLAPIVHFHRYEKYLPCSIEHILTNSVLKDLSPTKIWGQGTSIPAVVIFKSLLWMVYSDSKGSQMWVTYSKDGLNWNKASQIPNNNGNVPSLTVFNDQLWMVTGVAPLIPAIFISSSADGLKWNPAQQIQGQGTYFPTITAFKGKLWLVYTDSNGSEIYVSSSTDGVNWNNTHRIGQQTSVPAVTVFNGALWMVYSDSKNSNVWVTKSQDGDNWDQAWPAEGINTSIPALTSFNNQLWIAYTEPGNSQMHVASSTDGIAWNSSPVANQFTSVPAMAALPDKLCIVYSDSQSSQLWATTSSNGSVWSLPDIQNPTQADMASRCTAVNFIDINESQYAGEGLTAPMYYAVQEFPGYTEITYILLFAYNGPQTVAFDKNFEKKITIASYAQHPGDIERVTIRFTGSGDNVNIVSMTTEAHGNASDPPVQKSDMQFLNGRPLVYSALNSHATYNYTPNQTWIEEESLIVASIGDALGTEGCDGGDDQVWTPTDLRLVGLDANGEPISDEKWAKFAGRIGGHVDNSLTDGRYFDGTGLSNETWSYVKGLNWIASGMMDVQLLSGDGPPGLAERPYIKPASS